jgi:hypothetical protein
MKQIKLEYVLIVLAVVGGMFLIAEISREKPQEIHWQQPYQQPITPDNPPTKTYEDAINSITTEECRSHVYKLASQEWGGRVPGTQGNKYAADWIKAMFEDCGCKTQLQYIPWPDSKPYPPPNIIGWIDGTTHKNEIVVVGAHMDHVKSRRGICPGADDNASGTSAIIEIAQAFSMLPPSKKTVVFIAFNCEEMGLIGSKLYCNNPIFPQEQPNIKNHVFMLNFDMIGYLNSSEEKQVKYTESSPNIKRYVQQLKNKYPFVNSILKVGTGGGSDHQSFKNKGVPVAWCFTGIHSAYHTPQDTPQRIDQLGSYKGIRDIARLGFELVYKIANDTAQPVWFWDGEEILPQYDHDDHRTPFPIQNTGIGEAYRSNIYDP